MINGNLDEVDLKMLEYLQTDARIDVSRLVPLVHKSHSAVRKRIGRLKEAGFIRGYVAVLDRAMIGKPVLVVTLVKLERQTRELLNTFEATVSEISEVQFCLHLSGKWDFLLQVTAETPQSYYDFLMDKLCNMPNVAHVESSFVLKECKSFSPFNLG